MNLPVYEMIIDENPESDVEVSFVALVDKPAIEKNFLAFNTQFVKPGEGETKEEFLPRCMKVLVGDEGKENDQAYAICNSMWENKGMSMKMNFAINIDRQIISGPAMVPDTLIYRRDAGGEYNVFFSKDTIEKIALKFFKQDYQKNLNLFHDPNLPLQGVTIFESFVSDKARGVQPMKGFEDLPDGTWFISAKVENPDVWAKIQTGQVKGFSVEGIFSYVKKPKKKKNKYEEDLEEIINRTIEEEGLLSKNESMSKVSEIVARIKRELFDGTPMPAPTAVAQAAPVQPQTPTAPTQLQTDYQLKDGTPIQVDKLEIGGTALINGMPAPAGEHELADGTKITVGEGGVITLVTPAMAAAPALTMAEVELAINNALTKYKEELDAERLAAQQALAKDGGVMKEVMDKQAAQIKGLFEIIEKLTEMPTADPIENGHQSFMKEKAQGKEEKRQVLVNAFKKLKTA